MNNFIIHKGYEKSQATIIINLKPLELIRIKWGKIT